ncbi:hypothetical protein Tco_0476510 [Tanacetum coccineum]
MVAGIGVVGVWIGGGVGMDAGIGVGVGMTGGDDVEGTGGVDEDGWDGATTSCACPAFGLVATSFIDRFAHLGYHNIDHAAE